MSKHKCNSFSINVKKTMIEVRRYLLSYLRDAEDMFLNIMEKEIMKTTYGASPGKPEWRAMISDHLDIVNETVVDQYMKAEVGIDNSILYTDFVKAMIIAYGSGNKVGNGSIEAGPPGRSVWDENVDGKHPSKAEGNWLLPDEFNQEGNEFVENSVRIMKTYFSDL